MNLKMSDFLFEEKDVQDLDESNQADSEESETSSNEEQPEKRLKPKSQLGDQQLKKGPEILLSEMENTIAPAIAKTLFQVSSNIKKNAQLRDQTKDKKEKELSSKEKKALEKVDKVLDLPLGILDNPLLKLLFVRNFNVGVKGKIGGRIHLNPFQAQRGAEQIEGGTPFDLNIAKKMQMFFAMLSNEKSEIIRCNGKAIIVAIPAIGANCTPNLKLYSKLYPDVTKETPVPYDLKRVAFFLLPFDKFEKFKSDPVSTIETCLSQETTKQRHESFVYRQGLRFLLNESGGNCAGSPLGSTTTSSGYGGSGGSSRGGRSADDMIIETIMKLSLNLAQYRHQASESAAERRHKEREGDAQRALDQHKYDRESGEGRAQRTLDQHKYDRESGEGRAQRALDQHKYDSQSAEERAKRAEERHKFDRQHGLERTKYYDERDDRRNRTNRKTRAARAGHLGKGVSSALKAGIGAYVTSSMVTGIAATGVLGLSTAGLGYVPLALGAALFSSDISSSIQNFAQSFRPDVNENLVYQNHLRLLKEYRHLILKENESNSDDNSIASRIREVVESLKHKTVTLKEIQKSLEEREAFDELGSLTGGIEDISRAMVIFADKLDIKVNNSEEVVKEARQEAVNNETSRGSDRSDDARGNPKVGAMASFAIDTPFGQALRDINASGNNISDNLVEYLIKHSDEYLKILKASSVENGPGRDVIVSALVKSINDNIEDADIETSDIVKGDTKFKLTETQINRISRACAFNNLFKNIDQEVEIKNEDQKIKKRILEFCSVVEKIESEEFDDYYPVMLRIISSSVERPMKSDTKPEKYAVHIFAQQFIYTCLADYNSESFNNDDIRRAIKDNFRKGRRHSRMYIISNIPHLPDVAALSALNKKPVFKDDKTLNKTLNSFMEAVLSKESDE